MTRLRETKVSGAEQSKAKRGRTGAGDAGAGDAEAGDADGAERQKAAVASGRVYTDLSYTKKTLKLSNPLGPSHELKFILLGSRSKSHRNYVVHNPYMTQGLSIFDNLQRSAIKKTRKNILELMYE